MKSIKAREEEVLPSLEHKAIKEDRGVDFGFQVREMCADFEREIDGIFLLWCVEQIRKKGRHMASRELFDSRRLQSKPLDEESARRSRMKKQQHLTDLTNQGAQLRNENEQIAMQVNLITQQYLELDSKNSVLRAQVMKLTERLQFLNSMLHIFQEVSGMAMDIPEIPDPLLRPWMLPCPAQPIMASAELFQF